MAEKTIPVEEWKEFCESFSLQHHGWLASVRSTDTDALETDPASAAEQAPLIIKEQPFQSVRVEKAQGNPRIVVQVGSEPPGFNHLVSDPARLYRLERTRDHAHQGLRIDTESGKSTLVLFRAAAQPEMLDGMAASEL